MSTFEEATRRKLRFNSPIGQLNIEQLWDLPLVKQTNRTGTDLDTVGRAIQKELRSMEEDSLVKTNPDPRQADLQLQLVVIKHIITIKQDAAEKATKDAAKREERRVLLEALQDRKTDELKALSKEEIVKRLEDLN